LAKRTLRILTVCGTGGVTSSVTKVKVEQILREAGINAELSSMQASAVTPDVAKSYDLVVSTTPIPIQGVPLIVATSFLTGIGEEETKKKIIETAKKILGGK